MPDRPDVPEPGDLYANFARDLPLDWGDPIPTKADISATYSPEAAEASLALLDQVRLHHRQITGELLASLPDKTETFELNHRVKSPHSLARKIHAAWQMDRTPFTDDAMRFTVLAANPSQLAETAQQTVERLRGHEWLVSSAHHSYVKNSRYKGLHTTLTTPTGVAVEVQFHTPESIQVKMATTELYHQQRDLGQDPTVSAAAGRKAVELSAAMTQPPGLDGLHLGGVRVGTRRYGSSQQPNGPARGSGGDSAQHDQQPGRGRNIENDGRTR
jgi:hypothetical protein